MKTDPLKVHSSVIGENHVLHEHIGVCIYKLYVFDA